MSAPVERSALRRGPKELYVPVYQYACTACGEQLEVRQSFTDDALTECPVCAGRLRKVLSAVGVVFKGSGFYRTDSRAAESAASASGASTSDSNGSSESKESTEKKESKEPSKPKTDAAPKESKTPSTATKSAGSNGSGASSGSTTTPAAAR